jgi:hypothetical protein
VSGKDFAATVEGAMVDWWSKTGRTSSNSGRVETMSEPIQPALEGSARSYGGDITVPPYPPDEKVEFYNSPRRLAAPCACTSSPSASREKMSNSSTMSPSTSTTVKTNRNASTT